MRPSPTISTLRPAAFSSSRRAIFSRRQHAGRPASRCPIAWPPLRRTLGRSPDSSSVCKAGLVQAPHDRRRHRAAAGPQVEGRVPCRRRRDTTAAADLRRHLRRRTKPRSPAARGPPAVALEPEARDLAHAGGRRDAEPRSPRPAPRRGRRDGGSPAEAAARMPARCDRARLWRPAPARPSVSVPVLSNTTVSTSARRSSPSAALTSTPLAEQPAGGGHLHGRHGKRQCARAGDDEHGDGDRQRGLPSLSAQEPAEERDQPQDMHRRRIEPRGAVGEAGRSGRAPARRPTSAARSPPAACSGRWRSPRSTMRPDRLTRAGIDRAPGATRRGAVSPVIRLSSTSPRPSSTRPSTAKRSPAAVRMRMPGSSAAAPSALGGAVRMNDGGGGTAQARGDWRPRRRRARACAGRDSGRPAGRTAA